MAEDPVAPPPEPDPALGAAIELLRRESGVERDELARRAGVAPDTIARIERGEVDPRWDVVRRIAAALGVSLAELASVEARLRTDGEG